MIPLITNHTDELAEICRRHHVKRLEVFGSAAVGDFNAEKSDIDFLVEFDDSDEFLLFQTRRDLTQELGVPLQPLRRRSDLRQRRKSLLPHIRGEH